MTQMSCTSLEIRDAIAADLPAIVAIYNASIPLRTATADLEPITLASRQAWFEEHNPFCRPLWVAEQEGMTIGWLSFNSFYGRPAYHATAEISIYVHPAYQRQGIGFRLLQRAIDEGCCFDLRTLVAYIFAHNYSSLRLFEKVGFKEWGYLPRVAELDGVERDLVIMGRRLACNL